MQIEELVKQAFDPYVNLPLEEWKVFAGLGDIVVTQKEQILKSPDSTEKYLYFMIKGSAGVLLWKNNYFACFDIFYEGELMGDFMSFFMQRPTPLEVVTFEPSELFRITKADFLQLCSGSEIGNKIWQFASSQLFINKQKQQIDLLTKSATERYLELQTKRPEMIQRTPHKYLATYLGITPQSLSRIRRKMVVNQKVNRRDNSY